MYALLCIVWEHLSNQSLINEAMIRRLFYSLHCLGGFVICLLLSMWFITGLIIIYHPFPNVTNEQKYANLDSIHFTDQLTNIFDSISKIAENEKINEITLEQFQGQSLYNVKTDKSLYQLFSDRTKSGKRIDLNTIKNIAGKWSRAPISKIDTLTKRDIWIMYNRYMKELPVYKVYFDDEEKHQLYISSKSGEVQQFTSFSERAWAYIGAIPHKFYIPALRKNTRVWADTVTALSLVCLFVGITGLYVGIDVSVRRYRYKKRIQSPYRRKAYRWHHILGIIFSFFIITWSISGALSLRKVPQWMAKIHNPIPMGIKGKAISFDKYILDHKDILKQYGDVKQIEWSYFQGKPVYNVVIGNQQVSFDASTSVIQELNLTEADIKKAINHNHGELDFTIETISDYENYYMPWRRSLTLPVYKVTVADTDNSIYYINPKNGDYKYVNDNRKVRKWLFYGLHYFHIKWLVDKPVLWTITIWILVLGCTGVSLTGVWLGGRYYKRKFRKIKRRISSSNKK